MRYSRCPARRWRPRRPRRRLGVRCGWNSRSVSPRRLGWVRVGHRRARVPGPPGSPDPSPCATSAKTSHRNKGPGTARLRTKQSMSDDGAPDRFPGASGGFPTPSTQRIDHLTFGGTFVPREVPMRRWKILAAGSVSLLMVIAPNGAAGANSGGPAAPGGGGLAPVARPTAPPRAAATEAGQAVWQRLTPAARARAVERLRDLVAAKAFAPASVTGTVASPAAPAERWQDVVAGEGVRGTAGDMRGTASPTFTRRPAAEAGPRMSAAAVGDQDGDGLDQGFERQLADAFTPVYHISAGERAGTGFATFADRVPQTVASVSGPVPPISYFRVQPLGGATANGVPVGVVRLDYLTLWNRDDG